jgi:cytochrome c-type biogenesis protein CcmE
MTQTTWEKVQGQERNSALPKSRWKFIALGVLILGAVAYLVISGTMSGARYFMTVNDLLKDDKYIGQTVRISGAVIGDTIKFDSKTLTIDFMIVNVPSEGPDLARALHEAVSDPTAQRIAIHIENQPKPDLLQHEAQAIVTGKLGADGVFYANELLLKCPSRYQEADPAKAIAEPGNK